MDDLEYYTRRAERQLEMAQRATGPAAWNAHYQLATLYRDRSQATDEQPGQSELRLPDQA